MEVSCCEKTTGLVLTSTLALNEKTYPRNVIKKADVDGLSESF